MKFTLPNLASLCALLLAASSANVSAAPEIGKPAPDFTLTDSTGKSHNLNEFKGKFIVLEWTNPGCPFVVKHYGSNNMQSLQKKYTDKGVVWLSVNSTNTKHPDYLDPSAINAKIKEWSIASTAVLLDSDGKVGKAYEAKTTPNMFVINPEGALIYTGAIDSDSSMQPESIKNATNYVAEALDAALTGQPVKTPSTKPYGCGVKY